MIIDARGWRVDDDRVWNEVQVSKQPVFVLINKVDLLDRTDRLLPLIKECSERGNIAEIIPISVRSGHNLDHFLELVRGCLPIASPGFPLDRSVVQNLNFSVAELIREQVFRLAGAEIPYQSAVTVQSIPTEEKLRQAFYAEIWVESAGQKAILVGAGGHRLKTIGTRARKQVEYLLGTSVVLTTRVKVRQGWSSSPPQLRFLGYGD